MPHDRIGEGDGVGALDHRDLRLGCRERGIRVGDRAGRVPGESVLDVTEVPPVALIVPPPRSEAMAAELAPAVSLFTSVSESVPPQLAIAP